MVTGPILSAYSSTLTLAVFTSKSSYIVTEDINVYGSLTYDGSPVQDWLVALEVKDPYGTTVVTRTPQTDTNGEYNLTLRLPLQAKTGTYTVYVSSSYKGTPATNTTTFELMPRDVAVTDSALSKNVTGQGYSMSITVTAKNQGYPTETFNLTVYANASAIATQTLTLTSGSSAIVTFTWDTSGFAARARANRYVYSSKP